MVISELLILFRWIPKLFFKYGSPVISTEIEPVNVPVIGKPVEYTVKVISNESPSPASAYDVQLALRPE